jgi:geranylgeranyl diphosphate synthase type II
MEGKRSLILAHLFERVSESDAETLRGFLGRARERRLPRELGWIYELLRRHGSIEYAQRASRELAAAAVGEFETAFAGTRDEEAKRFVRRVLDYVVERAA